MGVPAEAPLEQAGLFDFSATERAERPGQGRVFLVGDALLEPFWPEGLGVVRGFLTVLDAVTAVALLSEREGEAGALALLERSYRQLKSLSLASGPRVLQPPGRHATHPRTRYRAWRD